MVCVSCYIAYLPFALLALKALWTRVVSFFGVQASPSALLKEAPSAPPACTAEAAVDGPRRSKTDSKAKAA